MVNEMCQLLRFSLLMIIIFTSTAVFSASNSIGDIAYQLVEPVSIVSDFIGTSSLIIGIMCVFASFLRYLQYRVNPLVAPMSTVIILLVLGLVLIGLPFIYKVLGYGLPFPSSY